MRDDVPQVEAQRIDEQVTDVVVPAGTGQPPLHREHEVAQGSHSTRLVSFRLADYRNAELARNAAQDALEARRDDMGTVVERTVPIDVERPRDALSDRRVDETGSEELGEFFRRRSSVVRLESL